MSVEILFTLARVNLAIAAAIVLVLLARKPLRALFGARIAYAAWAVVLLAGLAVLAPARVQSVAAPVATRSAPVASPDAAVAAAATPGTIKAGPLVSKVVLREASPWIVLTWLGIALLGLGVQAGRQRRFTRALGGLRAEGGGEDRLYHAQHPGHGPAVVGALSPRIVLPADFAERFSPEEQAVVVAHERVHLTSGDAQINALVMALRCLFWFNPLVHLAAARLRVDQELACDAAVLARFPHARRRYGEAMLKTQLAPLAPPLGCHWPAGGKAELLERLTMLGRDRPSLGRRLAGVALVAGLGLGTGLTAWAAQPPRVVHEATPVASTSARALGRQLIEALVQGDSAEARALIRAGADVNRRSLGDGTPLILAARNGDLALVELLLERGADPELMSPGDGNPLIMAAGRGGLDVTRRLVEAGAEVDAIVRGDETPLINAARSGDLAVVRYLVEQGADVNLAVMAPRLARLAEERRSPLGEAVKRGHVAVADYLRARGARA